MSETAITPANAAASLLDELFSEGKLAITDEQKPHARDLLSEFIDQVLSGTGKVPGDVVEAIKATAIATWTAITAATKPRAMLVVSTC